MDIDSVRRYCLSLAHTTEKVQWGNDLVFKVAGKMYAVVVLEPAPVWLSLRCTAEESAELVERPGIIPAPYLARAHWISLKSPHVLPRAELERLLRQAHGLTLAKLPKKTQAALEVGEGRGSVVRKDKRRAGGGRSHASRKSKGRAAGPFPSAEEMQREDRSR